MTYWAAFAAKNSPGAMLLLCWRELIPDGLDFIFPYLIQPTYYDFSPILFLKDSSPVAMLLLCWRELIPDGLD